MTEKLPDNKLKVSRIEELKILRRIADLTSSELDLDFILNEVINIVNDMTAADSVFIYLFDQNTSSLVLAASKIPHRQELGKITLMLGEGITGWVAKRKKSVVIKQNAYKNSHFKSFDILPEDKYEAFLSSLISYKGKIIGVINVQHKKQHIYTRATVNLVETIGKLIGGVIENARLYADARKKAVQFDSLIKVSKSISSEKYLDEILDLIVVVSSEMLNSKICSIMLLNKKQNELFIKATQSLSEEYKKKANLKIDKSLHGQVIQSGIPLSVYDVQKEEKYAYRNLAIKENLTSMLAVPMIVKDKKVGVISIYTNKHHVFTEEEINILQIVANQAAVAVENTKLMEEVLKAKEALEARKSIERAKGILIRMKSLSEDAAFKLIHKKSMDSCKTMKEISDSIILMDELQK
jgi:signal transduction protein with GAF and PtsI domain